MNPKTTTLPPEVQELLSKFPAHWTPEQRRSGEEMIRAWYAQSLSDLETRIEKFLKENEDGKR